MGLYEQLQQRETQGAPVRVGLIGAGKFGTMFLAQVLRIPGIHVVGVADLRVDVAKSNMTYTGWAADRIEAASLDAALSSGETHVGQDALALIAHHGVEIVIECTGNPVIAVDHALAAFAAGKHVISATVEADAVCGAALVKRAESAGVIYSQAYGDQPAMTVELVDWARTCGFEVTAAGRGHKWKPEYRFSTPDTIWDYWGVTAEKAERGRLNPKMFNSFLDGTKPAIESAAISNATGLNAPTNGLTYPSGAIDDIATLMRPHDAGGVLEEAGMVEVISSFAENGTLIPNDIRQGVWVVVKATSDYVKNCFEEYMVSTDESGLYYCNFKRFHLIGLELGLSVGSVGIRGEATGTSREFRSDVVAVSKKAMKAGEMLDGEGGYCVAGQLRPSRISVPMRALPLGLTGDIKLIRDVGVDTVLTYDDVEIDETLNAVILRRECEAMV
ncbi:flagellar biosynthesis protein FlgA [Roseovarius sp. LXJ103]|uniref:NAD(P)H-dependent oxidoreductase n=1 Tax=Roseovarius carneus TaxID=2853164 RepID=UPI000D604B87|nr:flagellar biosynthesis protein FlgA [Roseovarius carneus]MBZ8119449.1 flagellar biosynthesis protein FlgA [Roseovarius carneus]PWE34915.1 flagellar biosynthesis protein FlgA [Pelagicola sp. LXJ1103]